MFVICLFIAYLSSCHQTALDDNEAGASGRECPSDDRPGLSSLKAISLFSTLCLKLDQSFFMKQFLAV